MINENGPERIYKLADKGEDLSNLADRVAGILDLLVLDLKRGLESRELEREARRLVKEYQRAFNYILSKNNV